MSPRKSTLRWPRHWLVVLLVGGLGAMIDVPSVGTADSEPWPMPPVYQLLGEARVNTWRITAEEVERLGRGSVQTVLLGEPEALVLTRVAMGENSESLNDRILVMWNIRIRADLGYKNGGSYGGYRAEPDRWGPPTNIYREALCIEGCQYEPVELLFAVTDPARCGLAGVRAMIYPGDSLLGDFYLTWLMAGEIMEAPLEAVPIEFRGYDGLLSPEIAAVGRYYREGGLPSRQFFPGGNVWADREPEDNLFWEELAIVGQESSRPERQEGRWEMEP